MKSNSVKQLILCIAIIAGTTGFAQTKMVGDAKMYPSKNIVENASNSNIHTTLMKAVNQAGLVKTLKSKGPFTVFAPTNKAFDKLPEGTVNTLLLEKNKGTLKDVLTYHVIAGKVTAKDLMNAIEKHNGKYSFKTVNGKNLTAMMQGDHILLKDQTGSTAEITTADVMQSNGVIHVIDSVLLPE